MRRCNRTPRRRQRRPLVWPCGRLRRWRIEHSGLPLAGVMSRVQLLPFHLEPPMMIFRLVAAAVAAVCLQTASASAQGAVGRWEGTVTTPDGPYAATVDARQRVRRVARVHPRAGLPSRRNDLCHRHRARRHDHMTLPVENSTATFRGRIDCRRQVPFGAGHRRWRRLRLVLLHARAGQVRLPGRHANRRLLTTGR